MADADFYRKQADLLLSWAAAADDAIVKEQLRSRAQNYLTVAARLASPSPSALPARGLRRRSAFSSRARSLIAARSSSVNPLDALAVALAPERCGPFFARLLSATAKHLRAPNAHATLMTTFPAQD